MIAQYTLMMLCEKYGINSDKLVNKNNNILTYGEYQDIDSTLNYLVNILKISSNNIEKCPSILYKSVNNIKENVDFIKNCNIHFSNIESCLHVLNSEPLELQATYEYVKENYGLDIINKLTSIISVPNYCGEFDNNGAIMDVDEDLMCSFKVIKSDKKNSKS